MVSPYSFDGRADVLAYIYRWLNPPSDEAVDKVCALCQKYEEGVHGKADSVSLASITEYATAMERWASSTLTFADDQNDVLLRLPRPRHSSTGLTFASLRSRVDLNTASVDELRLIPGISRKSAERIIAFRSASGPFDEVSDLVASGLVESEAFQLANPYLAVAMPGAMRVEKPSSYFRLIAASEVANCDRTTVDDDLETWRTSLALMEQVTELLISKRVKRRYPYYSPIRRGSHSLDEAFQKWMNLGAGGSSSVGAIIREFSYLDTIFRLVSSAQKTIDVQVASLSDALRSPFKPLLSKLSARAQEGVKVRLLHGARDGSDLWAELRLTGDEEFAGIELRAYPFDDRLHGARAIFDSALYIVGSQNFSATSLRRNHELSVYGEDIACANVLQANFQREWGHADPAIEVSLESLDLSEEGLAAAKEYNIKCLNDLIDLAQNSSDPSAHEIELVEAAFNQIPLHIQKISKDLGSDSFSGDEAGDTEFIPISYYLDRRRLSKRRE